MSRDVKIFLQKLPSLGERLGRFVVRVKPANNLISDFKPLEM
jgi:hypothetical protein